MNNIIGELELLTTTQLILIKKYAAEWESDDDSDLLSDSESNDDSDLSSDSDSDDDSDLSSDSESDDDSDLSSDSDSDDDSDLSSDSESDDNSYSESEESNPFNILRDLNARKFHRSLANFDVNSKQEQVPLLHLIVRTAGPKHLQEILSKDVDVNALAHANTDYAATALQWLTGKMFKHEYGDKLNYSTQLGKEKCFQGKGKFRSLDNFVGTANEIMHTITNALIEKGAHVDFYSLCALGKLEAVKELLAINPALVNQVGPDGSTPLAWAARRNQKDIITLLLNYNANINAINTTGLTPFEETVLHHGDIDTLELLLNKGAIIRKGIIGNCVKNKIEILDYLFSKHPNPRDLISTAEIEEVRGLTYYEEYLKVFLKHSISLSSIDTELANKDTYPLIFSGCHHDNSIKLLRLLIALNVNMHGTFKHDSDRYLDATPLVFTYLRIEDAHLNQPFFYSPKKLAAELQKEINGYLKIMAVLFVNGATISPAHTKHPHPIDSLTEHQLIQFLINVYCEIKDKSYDLISEKLPKESIDCLKAKVLKIQSNASNAELNNWIKEYINNLARHIALDEETEELETSTSFRF